MAGVEQPSNIFVFLRPNAENRVDLIKENGRSTRVGAIELHPLDGSVGNLEKTVVVRPIDRHLFAVIEQGIEERGDLLIGGSEPCLT